MPLKRARLAAMEASPPTKKSKKSSTKKPTSRTTKPAKASRKPATRPARIPISSPPARPARRPATPEPEPEPEPEPLSYHISWEVFLDSTVVSTSAKLGCSVTEKWEDIKEAFMAGIRGGRDKDAWQKMTVVSQRINAKIFTTATKKEQRFEQDITSVGCWGRVIDLLVYSHTKYKGDLSVHIVAKYKDIAPSARTSAPAPAPLQTPAQAAPKPRNTTTNRKLAELERRNGLLEAVGDFQNRIVERWRCQSQGCNNYPNRCYELGKKHYKLLAKDIQFWSNQIQKVDGVSVDLPPPQLVIELHTRSPADDTTSIISGSLTLKRRSYVDNTQNPSKEVHIHQYLAPQTSYPAGSSSSKRRSLSPRRQRRARYKVSSPIPKTTENTLRDFFKWKSEQQPAGREVYIELLLKLERPVTCLSYENLLQVAKQDRLDELPFLFPLGLQISLVSDMEAFKAHRKKEVAIAEDRARRVQEERRATVLIIEEEPIFLAPLLLPLMEAT